MRKDGLIQQEGKIMDFLVASWNKFVKLDKQHPDDKRDFCDGIHKCQHILMSRVLRRNYPKGYLRITNSYQKN